MAVPSVDVMKKLEAGFEKLQNPECKSLLKKHLSREIFDDLKLLTTSYGSTLLDVIQSGVENLDSSVGVYAPDPEAYKVFAQLFDPIIEEYHHGFKKCDQHPSPFWGDSKEFGDLDPEGDLVISTRIRIGRSVKGFALNPCLKLEDYLAIEEKVKDALADLPEPLKGTFFSLSGMSKHVQNQLIDDHFLFKEGDRFLQAANSNHFWPNGRGIFHNESKTFLVWCNEEDHLRIISMQKGGNVVEVYERLVSALKEIDKKIEFEHDDRLGYLTFCPTNLGTTLRASVLIKIPFLLKNKELLREVTERFKLQVRGTRGEHSDSEGGIVDVSNKRRMGLTEFQAVKEMYEGVFEIINMERCLSAS